MEKRCLFDGVGVALGCQGVRGAFPGVYNLFPLYVGEVGNVWHLAAAGGWLPAFVSAAFCALRFQAVANCSRMI